MKLSQLKKGNAKILFCIVMILGALLLIGCGEDGKDGPPGPAGPAGPPGLPGTAIGAGAVEPETCVICHETGKVGDIAVAHPDPTNEAVIISAITLTNTAGSGQYDGLPVVSFELSDSVSGAPVTAIDGVDVDVDNFQFMMADLVPAGTSTTNWGTWDTDYWERWTYERTPTSSTAYPQGTLVNNQDGSYTYTFATEFGSPAATADAPDYDPTHPQRLYMRFDGRPDYPNRSVEFLDFTIPAANGSTATVLPPQRQFVTGEACKQCHGQNFERAAHADDYLDTRACVICHSPLGFDQMQTDPVEQNRGQFMQDTDAYASVFFHKIHGDIDIPYWTDMGRINGLGYSAVTYPQDIKDCVVCHNNDSGLDLGDQADQIDNWKTHPTAEICGSCHVDVNFATGENHVGGAWQNNETCALCHLPSGSGIGESISAAHDTTPFGRNVPEFDVNLTITPAQPSYAVGDMLQVRVTLIDHKDKLDVDPALYIMPKDLAGKSGGGLSIARLSVYGPRAKAAPVLTTGTITDPTFDSSLGHVPRQYADLFVGGNDPRVTTDSSGFSYQLFPIPNDMVPGTYMVRVRIADYGRVKTDDYVIESTAFTTIQIGTDVEENKVAGDACTNCHGTGKVPYHVETHAVAFDTDQCLACHDQSGNFAIPLANRVHAIHSANPEGDIYNLEKGSVDDSRDWFNVTYPQKIDSCVTCHNSGDDTYKTLPYMMPCAGCHVGEAGDQDIPFEPVVIIHMRQYGGPY